MKRICITTMSRDWPLFRQTPGNTGRWGDVEFVMHQEGIECDAWVVCEALPRMQTALCPPGGILFITGEPPAIRSYNPRFLDQFDMVLTSHPGIHHRGVIRSQQALQWMAGVLRRT